MFHIFKATLSDPSLLINSVSTIAELIDEGLFKITKEGITFVAADRAMVAVVDFSLSASAFEQFEIDNDQSMGLNVGHLLSVLRRASGSDKLSISLEDSKLEIVIKGESRRKFVVPLLELSQEEVPPINQLEFATKVEIKPDVLQSGIDDAEIVSDSVLFETSPGKFVMRAEGDVSRAELELENGNAALISLTATGDVKSRYPLDYLKKMVKASKIADSVSLEFGQDYPMKIGFKSGDKASLKFVLAPRVSDE